MVAPNTNGIESRQRILDAALALMSEHGAAGTSMRMLAGAADLNVATLYHYFPSKADLLRAVLREGRYLERLRDELPPQQLKARNRGPAARLQHLLTWLWWATLQEEAVWRLLVGESLRGDASARAEAMALVDGIDVAVAVWIEEVVPELAGRADHTARLVRAMLFSLIVEHLALGPDDDRVGGRIADLVAAVIP